MMAPAFCIGVCIGVVEMERRASYEGGGECGEDEALERLWERLAPELRALLAERQNFKIVINGSAGRTFAVEVVKTLRF